MVSPTSPGFVQEQKLAEEEQRLQRDLQRERLSRAQSSKSGSPNLRRSSSFPQGGAANVVEAASEFASGATGFVTGFFTRDSWNPNENGPEAQDGPSASSASTEMPQRRRRTRQSRDSRDSNPRDSRDPTGTPTNPPGGLPGEMPRPLPGEMPPRSRPVSAPPSRPSSRPSSRQGVTKLPAEAIAIEDDGIAVDAPQPVRESPNLTDFMRDPVPDGSFWTSDHRVVNI